MMKKKEVAYTVENKNSFYLIKSKIPAEYTGKFIRINGFVMAKLDCQGKDGWLVKVADAKPEVKAEPKVKIESEVKADSEVSVETEITTEDDCEE
jgi:hypothetical protein